jgi:hypothetical protein
MLSGNCCSSGLGAGPVGVSSAVTRGVISDKIKRLLEIHTDRDISIDLSRSKGTW